MTVTGMTQPRILAIGGTAGSLAIVVVCLALTTVAEMPVLRDLHTFWTASFTYSHGYLAAAVACYFLLRSLSGPSRFQLTPDARALGPLAVVLAITVLSIGAQVQIVGQLALPLVLICLVALLFGIPAAGRAAPAIGYLYFAIPVWDLAIPLLRNLTTSVVTSWIHAARIPAFIDDHIIHIPSGTFEVAEGCSGLHFLIVGAAIAYFQGLVAWPGWRRFAMFTAATCFLSVIANWVRVFTLVAVGHTTQMQHSLFTEGHYFFGWVVFAVFMAPLMVVAYRMEPRVTDAAASRPSTSGRSGATIAGGIVVLVAAMLAVLRVDVPPAADSSAELRQLPPVEGWRPAGEWADATRPVYVGPSDVMAGRLQDGTGEAAVFIARYARQSQGRELIFYANRPLGASAASGPNVTREVTMPGSESPLRFVESQARGAGGADSRLVWSSMWVAGRPVESAIGGKWAQAIGALLGRQDAQVMILSADCSDNCDAARRRLSDLAGALYPIATACGDRAREIDQELTTCMN